MPGASFSRVFWLSWKVASCCSPATDTSPATTPFSSIWSVRATNSSLARRAASAPWDMMLGTLPRTASNLVSASSAALNPSMASLAKFTTPATEMAPPRVASTPAARPAVDITRLNTLLAFLPQLLMVFVAALICFCWARISLVVPLSLGVNWSFRLSRMLIFLLAIQGIHLQLPGRQQEHPFQEVHPQQFLQAVPTVEIVGDHGQVRVALDQFFTASLIPVASARPYISRMAVTIRLISAMLSPRTAHTMSVGANTSYASRSFLLCSMGQQA